MMSLLMRTVIGAIVCSAIVTAAAAAHAEPAARLVYLRGRGTETCPSESELRQAVQVRLGYDPFSSYAASTMFAEVTAANGGFTANLKLVDGDNAVRGDRTLRAQRDCSALMDAMALTMSIAIDPMSVTRTGPPPDAPPSEKPVDVVLPTLATSAGPAEPDSADDVVPAPSLEPRAPVASRRPVGSIALGPLASLGSAPAPSVGGALTVDLQIGRLLGGIEGRADLPSSASAGELGRVESSLVTGSMFAGLREGPFFACAIGSLGRLSATSRDVATRREASALFAAGGLRVGAAFQLSERIEARIRAELLANLTRHTLEISGRPAYELPVASGNVGAALAVRFQ